MYILAWFFVTALAIILNIGTAGRRKRRLWAWVGWGAVFSGVSTAVLAGKPHSSDAEGRQQWGVTASLVIGFAVGGAFLGAVLSSAAAGTLGSAAALPLSNADWPQVQQNPRAYAHRSVALQVQVGGVLADTGGLSVQAFTQYGDGNPFDATTFTFQAGATVPQAGTFATITGTVGGVEMVTNAFGAKYKEADVSVSSTVPQTCAQAFPGAACGGG